MSIIIAGTVRLPPERLAEAKPHMLTMRAASRAEAGCVGYNYAEDITEEGLIHVFEVWRDQAAVDHHFASPHMAAWRAVWPSFGVSERRLFAYEVAEVRSI